MSLHGHAGGTEISARIARVLCHGVRPGIRQKAIPITYRCYEKILARLAFKPRQPVTHLCLDGLLLGAQSRNRFPATQFSHRSQLLKLRRPWAGLALLPVVDRLAGHAGELPIGRGGEIELAAVSGQATRAESPRRS